MRDPSLQRLRNLALQDDALRVALDAATDAADLKAIASQNGIALSDDDVQQWLTEAESAGANLTPEELDAISQGLSLTDQELEGMAGGGGADGEAAIDRSLPDPLW